MKPLFLYFNKGPLRLFVLFAVSLLSLALQAQQTKKTLKLADGYFAKGEYFTAAGLYAQLIQPYAAQQPVAEFPLNIKRKRVAFTNSSNTLSNILFKQGESYRLSHNWEAAATCYSKCAVEKSGHRIDALFWLAICQRNLGQYDAAEATLHTLSNESNLNDDIKRIAEEKERLAYIRKQLARPDTILFDIQKLSLPASGGIDAFAAARVTGDEFLISSTVIDSLKVKGINPYHSRLFSVTINQRKIEERKMLLLPETADFPNQGAASVSNNGNYLYFTEWKVENGQSTSLVYYSVKHNGNFSAPKPLASVNVKGFNSKQPFCSTDGGYLYFASDRPGGLGKFDIWYAPLKKDGSTGEAKNAGEVINTEGDEAAPFYQSSSATLVYASNWLQGMGGYDLFTTVRSDTTWSLPQNMGYPVNSVQDELYFFAPENEPLLKSALISSDRDTSCCLETYSVVKAAKKQALYGIIRDQSDSTPVANATIIVKDNSGIITEIATDADGRYEFALPDNYTRLMVSVSKTSYKEVLASLLPKRIDPDDLFTDKWQSQDIYLEHKEIIRAEDVVTVYFDFDRSTVKPLTMSKLDSIYTVLVKFPAASIDISGYSDESGTEQYNKILSDKRAKACGDYLISKGINSGRIRFEAFGACCPVEMQIINRRDNLDRKGLNRRALINVRK